MKYLNKGSLVCILFIFSLVYLERPCYSGVPLESDPRGIAINPITDVAVIADEKADSVSVVDMDSQKVIATIPVGRAPKGVALDNVLNIAAVTNSKDDTISLVDMSKFSVIKTIPAGKEPEGVAVNQATHRAIVANHKDDTVSLIDIADCRVIEAIPVGQGPIDVAIDTGQNIGLVVNEKKDYGIFVIDLDTYQVINAVSVGRESRAIDINSETRIAAVVNEKDNSISVIDLQTWQTSIIQVCKHPVDVAINALDNRSIVVCDEDNSLLLIDLNTRVAVQSYQLNKQPKGLAIDNFANVAAVTEDQTDSLTLIQLPNPVPGIISLAPQQVYRGSAGESISVEGNGFVRTSAANIGSLPLITTFIDNHHLQASVTKDLLNKAGSLPMSVENPEPMGGLSNNIDFEVVNPVPSISALEPLQAIAALPFLLLTIYGNGFFDDTTLYVNGVPRQFDLTSRIRLQSVLTSVDLETGAYLGIMAANPQPGGGFSNKADFAVLNPVPSLSAMSPVSAVAGSPDFTLLLTGDNFVRTSILSFNGQRYPMRLLTKTQIETTVPADAVKAAGKYAVKIINPAPGGGESTALTFTVKPPLEIAITSPDDGASINKSVMMVRGTFKSDTNDVGVVVNGIPAEITGMEWVANGVPLMAGTNTITATITDSLGNVSSTAIVVDTLDTALHARLSANITSGLAPLTILFSGRTEMPSPGSSYQIDLDGDGVIDYSGTSFDDISYTYTTEGVFYPTITVVDSQGNAWSDTIAITVLKRAEIEAVLKGKWEGIKGALAKGDTEKAAGFFAEDRKDMYRYNFTLMAPILPTIIKDLGDINLVKIWDDVAECEMSAIQDSVEYSFYVEFVKDVNGVWKLRFF